MEKANEGGIVSTWRHNLVSRAAGGEAGEDGEAWTDGSSRWRHPVGGPNHGAVTGTCSSAQACPSLCPKFRSGFPVRTGKRKANLPLPSPLGRPADEHSGVDEGAEGTCLSSPLLMK